MKIILLIAEAIKFIEKTTTKDNTKQWNPEGEKSPHILSYLKWKSYGRCRADKVPLFSFNCLDKKSRNLELKKRKDDLNLKTSVDV